MEDKNEYLYSLAGAFCSEEDLARLRSAGHKGIEALENALLSGYQTTNESTKRFF